MSLRYNHGSVQRGMSQKFIPLIHVMTSLPIFCSLAFAHSFFHDDCEGQECKFTSCVPRQELLVIQQRHCAVTVTLFGLASQNCKRTLNLGPKWKRHWRRSYISFCCNRRFVSMVCSPTGGKKVGRAGFFSRTFAFSFSVFKKK
ncbi:membrane-associated protein, putative [Bodo saltans]|uniref:Membrane-associated protein, putative n=1 Tax=Bodo saltans TaxID=75058 RepID=A0A0S4IMC1_BODSA|nr:membrane-associated protein, putative [Bodo saltans]|eukprot:CUE64771.1 membrane-associated protein, putative [Bodo saltans]